MGREWQPGDVALVRVRKTWYRALRDRVGWVVATDGAHSDHLETCEGVNYECRPLVVIDPEDREQVQRLTTALRLAETVLSHTPSRETVQAALRELAAPKPPKPAEPTGLGAVVEDADGLIWVRAGQDSEYPGTDYWRCVGGDLVGMWRTWDAIDAVRVLSEGI